MKKIILVLIAGVLCIFASSCTSSADKELETARETAREAQQSYRNASRELDKLERDLDDWQSTVDKVK